MSPGRDRVDGVAPPVRREVGARDLEHPRCRAVRLRGAAIASDPVARGCPRRAGGSRRRYEPSRATGRLTSASTITMPATTSPTTGTRRAANARATAFTPRPSSTARPRRDQRDRAAGAAQREPEVGRLGEALEQPPEHRRVVVRVGTHRRPTTPIERDEHEERAVPPPHDRGAEQREHRQRVAHRDQPEVLRVPDARLDPGTDLVAAVEEPVAEAAEHLDSAARRATTVSSVSVNFRMSSPYAALDARARRSTTATRAA